MCRHEDEKPGSRFSLQAIKKSNHKNSCTSLKTYINLRTGVFTMLSLPIH